jgi:hypothetical protein
MRFDRMGPGQRTRPGIGLYIDTLRACGYTMMGGAWSWAAGVIMSAVSQNFLLQSVRRTKMMILMTL